MTSITEHSEADEVSPAEFRGETLGHMFQTMAQLIRDDLAKTAIAEAEAAWSRIRASLLEASRVHEQFTGRPLASEPLADNLDRELFATVNARLEPCQDASPAIA